jgi:hypothetical protein
MRCAPGEKFCRLVVEKIVDPRAAK